MLKLRTRHIFVTGTHKTWELTLYLQYYRICIMTIYRAPSGDLHYFLNTVEEILNNLHNKFNNIILCGDININYHINCTFNQSMEIMI
jgi:exonuclease III